MYKVHQANTHDVVILYTEFRVYIYIDSLLWDWGKSGNLCAETSINIFERLGFNVAHHYVEDSPEEYRLDAPANINAWELETVS